VNDTIIENGFQIALPTKSYTFGAFSAIEKEKWLQHLNEAIQNCLDSSPVLLEERNNFKIFKREFWVVQEDTQKTTNPKLSFSKPSKQEDNTIKINSVYTPKPSTIFSTKFSNSIATFKNALAKSIKVKTPESPRIRPDNYIFISTPIPQISQEITIAKAPSTPRKPLPSLPKLIEESSLESLNSVGYTASRSSQRDSEENNTESTDESNTPDSFVSQNFLKNSGLYTESSSDSDSENPVKPKKLHVYRTVISENIYEDELEENNSKLQIAS